LPRPIIKSHPGEKEVVALGYERSPVWGDRFHIYVLVNAGDFKFGKPLECAKYHHTISPRRISGHGVGLGELSKIGGSF